VYSEDFVIVDGTVVPPEGEGHHIQLVPQSLNFPRAGVRALFTEGLVYLPTTYQANTYYSHHGGVPPYSPEYRPVLKQSGQLVIANLNSGHKIEPTVFSVWMNILRRVPNAVLWILRVGKFSLGQLVDVAPWS
jgi:predicted O-linked N-acetylglucosamine transferase (SPINDLY family)